MEDNSIRRTNEPGHPAGPVRSVPIGSEKAKRIGLNSRWHSLSSAQERTAMLLELMGDRWLTAKQVGDLIDVKGSSVARYLRDVCDIRFDDESRTQQYRRRNVVVEVTCKRCGEAADSYVAGLCPTCQRIPKCNTAELGAPFDEASTVGCGEDDIEQARRLPPAERFFSPEAEGVLGAIGRSIEGNVPESTRAPAPSDKALQEAVAPWPAPLVITAAAQCTTDFTESLLNGAREFVGVLEQFGLVEKQLEAARDTVKALEREAAAVAVRVTELRRKLAA